MADNSGWVVMQEGHGGPSADVWPLTNGSLILRDAGQCYCKDWYHTRGNGIEYGISQGCDWFAFALSVIFLAYYGYATFRSTCGWEEVYVCSIELVKVMIDQFLNADSPATLYLSSGNRVLWIRYGEWLLTCPVILIHLSNITGLNDDYSKRTMKLLVSDIGTIVFGVTSAMCTGYPKVIFFVLGAIYGASTFFNAAKVYIESYHSMPKGICRTLVRTMAWVYYVSWGMFPVLFVLGPEGFNHMNLYQSNIAHTVIDLMSKNIWGMIGHVLRHKIREHILVHGDLRKKQIINVAGEEMEIETMMHADEVDEETTKVPTKALANRDSFIVMRDRMKEKGIDVRASLEESSPVDFENAPNIRPVGAVGKPGFNKAGAASGKGLSLEPGRVILAVPDISMVDFFREQFALLPGPIELIPALGADVAVQIAQQALPLGGCDFVLVHPEFLRDQGATGVVARLRSLSQRVCAFGWSKAGPIKELIESSDVDGWLEGPSFGALINRQQLEQLVAAMQARKRNAASAMLMGLGGIAGMGGGMGSMGMGMYGSGGSVASPMSPAGMPGGPTRTPVSLMTSSMNGATGSISMPGPGSARMGTVNPLYGAAPSPLNSQPGANSATAAAVAGGALLAQNSAAPRPSEAEVLQQLMSEIQRLRSELGEQ